MVNVLRIREEAELATESLNLAYDLVRIVNSDIEIDEETVNLLCSSAMDKIFNALENINLIENIIDHEFIDEEGCE